MRLFDKISFSVMVLYVAVYPDMVIVWLVLLYGVCIVLNAKTQRLTRYQKLRKNGGRHTDLEWRLLKFYYGNRCHYCGKRGSKLTKDHIIPVSRGGSDIISNIVPACQSCNSRKSNKIVFF